MPHLSISKYKCMILQSDIYRICDIKILIEDFCIMYALSLANKITHQSCSLFNRKFSPSFNAHMMCMNNVGNLFPIYCEVLHSGAESLLEYSTACEMLK